MPSHVCCGIVSHVFAILLIVGGALVYELLPPYVHKEVKAELPVTDPSASNFDSFVNSSSKVQIYQNFYIFNCTNPYDVVMHQAAPNLVEVGPYVYLTTQWRNLDNITWFANATVAYTYHETYEFQPGVNGGRMSNQEIVTSLNLGLITAQYRERHNATLVSELKLLAYLMSADIFINVTVDQLLFGYTSEFLEAVSLVMPGTDPNVSVFTNDDPSTFAAPTALWTGGKAAAGSPAQPPPNSMNYLTQWEGYQTLPFWNASWANMINGTDGTVLSPGITSSDRPYVFVDTLYRSCTLEFDSKQTYQDVDLLRFVLAREMLVNTSANIEAFHMYETGFLPTPPQGNVSLTFSKPHFLDASLENVHVNITALPIPGTFRDAYETTLDAEPNTGLLFRVHKRIQLNVYIEPSYSTLGPAYLGTWFPMLWADENMHMPSNLVDTYKKEVQLPLDIAKYGGISAMALGGALVVVGIVAHICGARARKASREGLSYSSLTSQRLNSEF